MYLTPGICAAVVIMLVPPRNCFPPFPALPSSLHSQLRTSLGCKVARLGLKPPALFARGNKKPGYYYCYCCCYYRRY